MNASAPADLRLLLLIDSLGMGGAERLLVPLATGLRGRGIDARVGYLGFRDGNPIAAELRARGVPLLELRLRSLLDPRPPLRLASYLRRARIDVLHTHLRYADLVGRVAAALARRPVVSTIHTLVEVERGWRAAVRRWMDHLTARTLCTAVVAVSEAQRKAYQQAAGIDARRVLTLWNGVDTRQFRPDPAGRARVRARLGIAPTDPVFVSVAVLRPGKGLEFLLEAFAGLRGEAPGARLLVVGDGPERAALQRRAEALGLKRAVCFLGFRSDVASLLAASDVSVHPSLFEALPTAVLEAMASGLPVVASDVGGVPEVVIDGRSGILVPPGQPEPLRAAMSWLLDGETRRQMGEAAQRWVELHASIDLWLDRLERLYRDLSGRCR